MIPNVGKSIAAGLTLLLIRKETSCVIYSHVFTAWQVFCVVCMGQTYCHYLRFQVPTAASMKFRIVFWDVLPCRIISDRRFRGTCCFHHQGWDEHVPLKRRSTIILHGSISQKIILSIIIINLLMIITKWYPQAYWIQNRLSPHLK
jgi:hypothetical protein